MYSYIEKFWDIVIFVIFASIGTIFPNLYQLSSNLYAAMLNAGTWSVIPDTEGDGTDALIYKGSFKAAGEITKGTATTTDGWKTCTFTAGGE